MLIKGQWAPQAVFVLLDWRALNRIVVFLQTLLHFTEFTRHFQNFQNEVLEPYGMQWKYYERLCKADVRPIKNSVYFDDGDSVDSNPDLCLDAWCSEIRCLLIEFIPLTWSSHNSIVALTVVMSVQGFFFIEKNHVYTIFVENGNFL